MCFQLFGTKAWSIFVFHHYNMAVLFEYLGTFCHISTSSSFSFSLSITLSLSPHAHPHTNTDPVMHNSRLCNIYAVFQSSSELSTNGAGPESSVWTQRECWRLIRWDRPKLGGQCSRRHWNHKTSIPPKISWCARALVSEAYKNRQPKKGKRENRTVHGTVRAVTCPET